MKEIKHRTTVLDQALFPWRENNMASVSNAELAALQLRKIYELVAFAALAAHREQFVRKWKSFQREWRLDRIVKTIHRQNPGFLPVAIKEEPDPQPGVAANIVDLEEPRLSAAKLLRKHGWYSQYLHAANPYGKLPSYTKLLAQAVAERDELVALLNMHRVEIVPNSVFYRVVMQASQDQEVHCAVFERTEN